MIIAATHSDEVNMVTCQIAHSVFTVPRKIARLRSQDYLDVIYSDIYQRDHMPIDVVISPEKEVADAAVQQLASPSTFDTEPFLGAEMRLLGINLEENCAVLDTSLREMSELFSTLRARTVGIRRNGKLFVPQSNELVRPGDQVYVCSHKDDVSRTLEVFGKTNKKQERIIIIGGGNVGLRVAKQLENSASRIRAKMIEKNRDFAEAAADALERTIVLHGDGLDMEILEEANITKADALLAVTDDDKTNLLACARAKAVGCSMTVALVNDPTLSSLMNPLNIDAFVNPRATTVSSILRHIRHGRVRAVYSIGDAEAEVIEAQVMSTSPIAGRVIRDVEFPEGALIGMVKRGDKMIVPRGDTRIEEGDVVVIFTLSADVSEVERLFQVNIEFF
jgi:trk system potassium uptake protein TrkA